MFGASQITVQPAGRDAGDRRRRRASSNVGALQVEGRYAINSFQFLYAQDGRRACRPDSSGTRRAVVAARGTHGGIALSLCGGDETVQGLRVAQCVMRTDTPARRDAVRDDPASRARCACDGSKSRSTATRAQLRTRPRSASSRPCPPASRSRSRCRRRSSKCRSIRVTRRPRGARRSTSIRPSRSCPVWTTGCTSRTHQFHVRGRQVTGSEGRSSRRPSGRSFAYDDGRQVDLRGQPRAVLPPDRRLRSRRGRRGPGSRARAVRTARDAESLARREPSHGAGASGGVKFEVLDARGRRGCGWPRRRRERGWTGLASRSGGPLAPGLYFVRATDDAGHTASRAHRAQLK